MELSETLRNGTEQLLSGIWEMAWLADIEQTDFRPESVSENWEKVLVPSAFDANPPLAGKRGSCAYRREFRVPVGHRALLRFEAVSMHAWVYVDGELVAENRCGYVPFDIVLKASDSERRSLVVLADNRYDFSRIPMHEEYFDFYQYGGIIRDVSLRILPGSGAYLETLQITPAKDYRNGSIELAIGTSGKPGAAGQRFAICIDEGEEIVHDATEADGDHVTYALTVPKPELWSPEEPNLHRISVRLLDESGEVCDQLKTHFGLRRIEAREGKLWLNEEQLVLKGVNRHEWHPNFGPCTPVPQLYADLQLLRAMGCNFVRGSHYPQSQRFLDLCDILGMLVWEENLGWGQRKEKLADPRLQEDHTVSLDSMIRSSFNHPSVIIWGFLNEAETNSEEVRPFLESIVTRIRKLDPSRLISYATNVPARDKHLDLVDLISMNLYPGWYGCEGKANPIELIAPTFERDLASLDARGLGDKPVIISEIGAEALYGWREPHNDFFSETYQSRYVVEASRCVLENPRFSGIAIWHFSDVRTYGGGWSIRRPRTFNNKGIFDEYRRPKEVVENVSRLFKDQSQQ